MAKRNFTALELEIWHSIYGASRGPSSGRLKILVEDFSLLGLVPVMMRVDEEMLPYEPSLFQKSIRTAMDTKADDLVQVYYHPVECERVVGSSATTWTHWGRCILEAERLVLRGALRHPLLQENVPQIRLPVVVREALEARGVRTASICRLVSARILAFFIAAQYEAWATPHEVAQVFPFKSRLQKLGFTVRTCDVRRDVGVDDVLRDLSSPVCDAPISPDHAHEETFDTEEESLVAAIEVAQARLDSLRQRKASIEACKQYFLASTVSDVGASPDGKLNFITLQTTDGRLHVFSVA